MKSAFNSWNKTIQLNLEQFSHFFRENKLISSKWKLGKTDKQRKYYRITSAGKKQLQVEKNNWFIIHNIFEQLWKTQINFGWK